MDIGDIKGGVWCHGAFKAIAIGGGALGGGGNLI